MTKTKSVPATKRRKSAVATRTAILEAARSRFAANGYEHTGVRDIAADAGVDASLICRYFGSKQELLAEILATQPDCAEILDGPMDNIGKGLAARVLLEDVGGGNGDAVPVDLLIILRAASSSEAAPLLRSAIEKKFTGPLQKRLRGEGRNERAMLAASFVLGSMVLRSLLKVSPARGSDPVVTRRLARAIQTVIDSKD
jgi:AcrR family transcriptional regulator